MTTTSTGKMMTTPSGTETLEFPRNRKGLRKKARRDASPLFFEPFFSSTVGSCSGGGVAGTSLVALRNRSMAAAVCLSSRESD